MVQLTDEQTDIINLDWQDRALVQAGPGAGKTEVVARRLDGLLKSGRVNPSSILVLSFSRSAVKALVNRLRSLEETDDQSIESLRHLSVRTFDSWAFRMLRFLEHEPHQLLRHSHDKNIKTLIDELQGRTIDELLGRADLHLGKIKHIIVDEFQDLTGLRANLVKGLLSLLAPGKEGRTCGFTLLGDSDQAIYEWTREDGPGISSRELIAWVDSTYNKTLHRLPLSVNHRSEKPIASVVREASSILRNAQGHNADPLVALEDFLYEQSEELDLDDVIVQVSDTEDSRGVAILCRSNTEVLDIGMKLERELEGGNVLLDICAGDRPPCLPAWIGALFYQCISSTVSQSQFRKMYMWWQAQGGLEMPCHGDWQATWNLLMSFAKMAEDEVSVSMNELRERISWPDSLPDDEGEDAPDLTVTTIHKSKGLEYDLVNICASGDHEGNSYEEAEDEARVLYVGISRARSGLHLLEKTSSRNFFIHKGFNSGSRKRWHRWFKGSKRPDELEVGLDCDLDTGSFVRADILGGKTQVEVVQSLLMKNQDDLVGRKVVLQKTQISPGSNKFVYDICLEEPFEGVTLLGRTSQSLTFDLLDLKHEKQTLPFKIINLRIHKVVTFLGTEYPGTTIPEPWSTSRMWLGINIHGLAKFWFNWKKN